MREPCIVTSVTITSTGNAEIVDRDDDGEVVARAIIINEDGSASVHHVVGTMLQEGVENGIYALNECGLSRLTGTTGEIHVAS